MAFKKFEKKQPSARKVAKQRLIFLNKKIKTAGQKKELGEAKKLFEEIKSEGLEPSVLSYTSLLNAYVRSGDLDGAQGVIELMRKAGCEPNVVTYTSLLKGYSQDGNLVGAKKVMADMKKNGVELNIRTYNTFLRGCVIEGAYSTAEKVLKKNLKIFRVII